MNISGAIKQLIDETQTLCKIQFVVLVHDLTGFCMYSVDCRDYDATTAL
jgi:hypothetical protein